MKVIVGLFVICASLGTTWAAPQDYYGGPPGPAFAAVSNHFQCDETDSSPGFEICKTKINIGQGIGLEDLRISVRHLSAPLTGGVTEYIFGIRYPLIRDTSFRGMVGLAGFFGADIAKTLNTKANYEAYLRGQDVFEAGGLLFEVEDTSSFKLTVHSKTHPKNRLSTLSDKAPDEKECTQTNGVPGWSALWSDKRATIRPAFKRVSPDYRLAAGDFIINKEEVTLRFLPPGGPVGGEYVTLIVDQTPIFQSRWTKKESDTCCTYFVKDKLPRDTLFAMANHKTGMVIISTDAEGKWIRSASQFDLTNIGKAADMAIGGRFERAAAKDAGQCTGF